MATRTSPRFTPQEYLARERAAEYKSEYYNGEIFALAGASRRHTIIVWNIGGELRTQLKNRPCEAYQTEMRVSVTRTGLYTYPDVVVVCGTPQFEDGELDTLLNPTVIFEVLSESTEAYDRGKKFAHYRALSSLQDYILVAQNEVRVDRYHREADGRWMFTSASDPEADISIPSIQCTLKLAEVYHKVSFEEEEE